MKRVVLPEDSILGFTHQDKNAHFYGITHSSEDGSNYTTAQPTPFGGSLGILLGFQVDLKKKKPHFDSSQP